MHSHPDPGQKPARMRAANEQAQEKLPQPFHSEPSSCCLPGWTINKGPVIVDG